MLTDGLQSEKLVAEIENIVLVASRSPGIGASRLHGRPQVEATSAKPGHDHFHVLMLTTPAQDLPTAIVRMPTQASSAEGCAKTLWIDSARDRHIDGGDKLAWNRHGLLLP